MPRPRWALTMEAQMWRNLMDIGMRMHVLARPPAPAPDKTIKIPTTLSTSKGEIDLHFYFPEGYTGKYAHGKKKKHGRRHRKKNGGEEEEEGNNDDEDGDKIGSPITRTSTKSTISSIASSISGSSILSGTSTTSNTSNLSTLTEKPSQTSYPVLLNFHGGGFTIGRATDDARWARSVLEYTSSIVVSVEYRLAPEYPFPTAIEDGVDAALYLIDHASEFLIDVKRIAFSGFSAGGNMSFSVPIRLEEELRIRRGNAGKEGYVGRNDIMAKRDEARVVAIAAWYPSLDYTKTREERRSTNVRKDKDLPKFFTNLFDASYLHPPGGIDLASPWLSPGIAPDHMISKLPENIVLYTCEYDELQNEGEVFYRRLVDEFGKKVVFKKVMGVQHAFDKTPNPVKWDPKFEGMYRDACKELRRVFWGDSDIEDGAVLLEKQVDREEREGAQKVDTRVEVVELPPTPEGEDD
ncbi:hypothetical protein AAF712_013163 [Marasmius tenuissimus]|uniref:Alpha/beta hydrolase fold-3 domain-containing protein n=1 Tax=Marasmius tenuissimus TaxID=585030 RepID=A0ABR2ZFF2_9AGAR